MASCSLSLAPLQLGRCASSSTHLGVSTLRWRPHSSVHLQSTRGLLRPVAVAAASYHDGAAGHGDNGGAAATSVLRLGQVDSGAPETSKGRRPGDPKEGDVGNGEVHVAASMTTWAAKRVLGGPKPPPGLPAEGSGGHGGIVH